MAAANDILRHAVEAPAGRRSRQPGRRPRRVEFSLSDEEFGELGAAAARAGLARGAYAAEARCPSPGREVPRRFPAPRSPRRVRPRSRTRPAHRRKSQPGGSEAERHRSAFRRTSPVRH
jgi:hypothetical protein